MSPLGEIPVGVNVVVDTAPLIYYLEDRRPFAQRFAPVFERAQAGEIRIAISTITLAEVLAGPFAAGDEILAERYRVMLTGLPGWRVVDVNASVSVTAARMRARFRLRLPDAIQLATVIEVGAYALVTHDRDFRRVRDLLVLS